jgi:hypothetical protein
MNKISLAFIAALVISSSVSGAFADVGETREEAAPAPEPVREAAKPQPAVSTTTAERPVAPVKGRVIRETILKETEPESFTGKVDCVLPASLMRPKASMTVIDDSGNACEFVVKCLAVIYSPDGAILSLCEIGPGARVQVNYRTRPSGAREAFSIKVMK